MALWRSPGDLMAGKRCSFNDRLHANVWFGSVPGSISNPLETFPAVIAAGGTGLFDPQSGPSKDFLLCRRNSHAQRAGAGARLQ